MIKLLAFSASNNKSSINQNLVDYACNLLDSNVFEINTIDLKKYNVEIYSDDINKSKGVPQEIKSLFKLFINHDAFIIGLPEHNGSLTSLFKNIIDWLSVIDLQFFKEKPLLLLSTSPGNNGGKTGLLHFIQILPFIGGGPYESYSLSSYFNNFDEIEKSIMNELELTQLMNSINKFENFFINS